MPAIKLKKKTQEYLAEKEKMAKEAASMEKEKEKSVENASLSSKVEKKRKFTEVSRLDGEVILEKRKRTIPIVEQKCADWVVDNFESKEDTVIGLPTLYQYYTNTASLDQANVVDIPVFNRIVKEKVGDRFGVKESSPLKGLLKEKKPQNRKPKVQGETLNLKMKHIIAEIINSVGNPLKGIQFAALKKKIGIAYPALQVEIYPGKLISALDRGVRFGQLNLVKGTGKCGFYRIPGESTAEEDKPKPKKEKPKKKEKTENGENESESTGDEGEPAKEEEEETPMKKGKKKQSSNTNEEQGDKPEGDEEKDQAKKKKKKKPKRQFYDTVSEAEKHAEPQGIGDVFPMAITFMGDPKEASTAKIKNYIQTYYPEVDCEAVLKKALAKGEEKGLWQKIGSEYRILTTDFNPSYSDDINDMITQAIMASHTPKVASAVYIKKYITQYHSDLGMEARPYLFKAAIARAIKKGTIRQVSGIGGSGSFQLVNSFVPSPAILAGEVEDEREDERNVRYLEDSENEQNTEVYIVRKTKSGRFGGSVSKPSKIVSSSNKRRR